MGWVLPAAIGAVVAVGVALAVSLTRQPLDPTTTVLVEAPTTPPAPAAPAAKRELEDAQKQEEEAKAAALRTEDESPSTVAEEQKGEAAESPEAAETGEPASPGDSPDGSMVTVAIRSSPSGAMLFHNDRLIGNGRATLSMKQDGKARLLALLNNHEPTRLTIDGSDSDVVIYLKPNAKAARGDAATPVSQSPAPAEKHASPDESAASTDEVEAPAGKPTPRSEAAFFRRMNDLSGGTD